MLCYFKVTMYNDSTKINHVLTKVTVMQIEVSPTRLSFCLFVQTLHITTSFVGVLC